MSGIFTRPRSALSREHYSAWLSFELPEFKVYFDEDDPFVMFRGGKIAEHQKWSIADLLMEMAVSEYPMYQIPHLWTRYCDAGLNIDNENKKKRQLFCGHIIDFYLIATNHSDVHTDFVAAFSHLYFYIAYG